MINKIRNPVYPVILSKFGIKEIAKPELARLSQRHYKSKII